MAHARRLVESHRVPRYAVDGAFICHRGRVRRANEDAWIAGKVLSTPGAEEMERVVLPAGNWMVAVSDGIGGHVGGAEASREVVESLAECSPVSPAGVASALKRLNRRLCERGRKDSRFAAMGATVAGLASGRRGLFAFNVGDSRVYRQDGARLVQITRDDSEAEEMIDQGLLQPVDGKRPGFLHALTQAVGGRHEVIPITTHVHPLRVVKTARFLVCTDGLTDMLLTSEIEAAMTAESDAGEAVMALFERTMIAGGIDNITIAVFDVEAV